MFELGAKLVLHHRSPPQSANREPALFSNEGHATNFSVVALGRKKKKKKKKKKKNCDKTKQKKKKKKTQKKKKEK
eukprot:NODE_20599_length_791_cov_1.911145.p4 GENE.NODE_20599_length_791_cov_1.911145~~NODE_20599_length_791_cov_1.911145.p4  ORF type:complete len:75 (+),score=48.00 NODE_20599_length_791_cov_1.911145:517-741(+)